MNSTEVQNPQPKLDDKCLCLSYVFGSVLACMCKVCSRVSEALLLALLIVSNNSSSDSKAFLRFIAFSSSLTTVHHLLHALRYYTVGIPFWTARKRQRLCSTEKLQYLMLKSLDRTLLLRTCCGDVYGNIPHEENRWLTCSHRKFIILLTFELSSFRENGF